MAIWWQPDHSYRKNIDWLLIKQLQTSSLSSTSIDSKEPCQTSGTVQLLETLRFSWPGTFLPRSREQPRCGQHAQNADQDFSAIRKALSFFLSPLLRAVLILSFSRQKNPWAHNLWMALANAYEALARNLSNCWFCGLTVPKSGNTDAIAPLCSQWESSLNPNRRVESYPWYPGHH